VDGKRAARPHQPGERGVDREQFGLGHEVELARRSVADDDEIRPHDMIAGDDTASGQRHVLPTFTAKTREEAAATARANIPQWSSRLHSRHAVQSHGRSILATIDPGHEWHESLRMCASFTFNS
jgi:hypothetical protein